MGMHAQPAMGFVDLAGRFESEVRVGHADYAERPGRRQEHLRLMMLATTDGTELEISTEGSDAAGAVERLCRCVQDGFEIATPIAARPPSLVTRPSRRDDAAKAAGGVRHVGRRGAATMPRKNGTADGPRVAAARRRFSTLAHPPAAPRAEPRLPR